jgi:hypothetical protein
MVLDLVTADCKQDAETDDDQPYGISLSETGKLEFPSANEGYAAQKATIITVTNIGKEKTGKLTVAIAVSAGWSFTTGRRGLTSTIFGRLKTVRRCR